MKSLNRTLSLVLVLVMVLGLFGVAGAAFTDQSSVTYTEGVGVMVGIGAIDGYTDGSFKPTGAVTREEAAKMIAYAILGKDVASKLTVSATGFSDVAATRWSAPFISYLVGQGIINGMGDGTFAPTANVTAYQLAKMMLAAAGYGAKGEFTGSGWELAVAVKANTTGIFSGASGVNYSAAATREEAALYIFNGITNVPMVTYSKLTETYSNVPNAVAGVGTASDNAVKADLVMQIAESVYGAQLVKAATTVDGVSGHKWTYKGSTIVSFAADATVLATDKTGTAYNKLTTNTDSAYIGYTADTAVKYFYNGVEFAAVVGTTTSNAPKALTATDRVLVLADNKLYSLSSAVASGDPITTSGAGTQIAGLKGVVITFSDTDSNSKYDVVSFTKDTVYQLSAAPTTKTTGEVTTVTVSGIFSGVNVKYVSGYEGLAKDDVVLYHSYVSGGNTYYVITKAASFTGTMAAFNSTGRIALINGAQYKLSELTEVDGTTRVNGLEGSLSSYLGQADSTFYTDECGFIAFAEPASVTTAASNTAFILGSNFGSDLTYTTPTASLLMSDGTVVKATISKLNGKAVSESNKTLTQYDIYTFVKNTDGTYNLTAITANKTLGGTYSATNKVIDKGVANFFYTSGGTHNTDIKGTASTVFVVETSADTYAAFTGVSNAPNVTAPDNTVKAVVLTDSNGYAIVVFALNGTVTNTVNTSSYIFAGVPATEVYDAAGNYYLYTSAVVNGAVGTLPAVNDSTVIPGVLQAVTSYDGSKVATANSAPSGIITPAYDLTGFTVKDGTLTTKGTVASYIVTDTTKYFLFDVTDYLNPELKAVTADDIAALDGDKYALQAVETSATDKTLLQVYVTVYPAAVSVSAIRTTGGAAIATGATNGVTVTGSPVVIKGAAAGSATPVAATDFVTDTADTIRVLANTATPSVKLLGVVYAANASTAVGTVHAAGADIKLLAHTTAQTFAVSYYAYPFVGYTVAYGAVTAAT